MGKSNSEWYRFLLNEADYVTTKIGNNKRRGKTLYMYYGI